MLITFIGKPSTSEQTNFEKHQRLAYLDPNIHNTLKPRRGRILKPSVKILKIAFIADKYNVDMQRVQSRCGGWDLNPRTPAG